MTCDLDLYQEIWTHTQTSPPPPPHIGTMSHHCINPTIQMYSSSLESL